MTWLVARRELRQRAKTRAFAISTVVLLIAVALGVALPAILSRNAKPERIGYVGRQRRNDGRHHRRGRAAGGRQDGRGPAAERGGGGGGAALR